MSDICSSKFRIGTYCWGGSTCCEDMKYEQCVRGHLEHSLPFVFQGTADPDRALAVARLV